MIKLTEILLDLLAEKKLCPKGRAYYDRRRAAGEKPSAYLSGRAVKVCKGLMEENEELINCEACGWEWNLEDGGKDPFVCHKCGNDNSDKYTSVEEHELSESLRDWFKKEDWVRIDTAGNITGPCGTMKKGNKTTRCLPRAKANSLTKAERAATSKKKAASDKQFVPNTKKAKVKLRESNSQIKSELKDNNDYQMVSGIINILKKVKDKENRMEIADSMVSQFKKEKIKFDYTKFIDELR